MIDIPEEHRARLFHKFLRRGQVLKVAQYPGLQAGPKDKFLVVLNWEIPLSGPIFHVLTTSQVQKIRGFAWAKALAIIIPEGMATFFPRETAINCQEVISLPSATLEARYAEGTLEFIGSLSNEIMDKIDSALRSSAYISPKVRRSILGD